MPMQTRFAAWVALSLTLTGCATTGPKLSVLGRPVDVSGQGEGDARRAKGELIAVGPEQLFVLEPGRVRELPLAGIDRVRVRQHGMDGRHSMRWVGLGALITGGALAGACTSVKGNSTTSCLGVGAVVAATWALIGGLSAASLESSSKLSVTGPDWDALRPYARFPQGVPEGFDLSGLLPTPPSPRPDH